MSYDYNALVAKLASHREAAASQHEKDPVKYGEHVQEALQVFDTLSSHCPMSPLLWMQYAFDMSELMRSLSSSDGDGSGNAQETARQTRIETLEVGLNEFPGSAILQLHYCELLVNALPEPQSTAEDEAEKEKYKTVQKALLRAIKQVGSGSHRNEDEITHKIFTLCTHFYMHYQKSQDGALACLLQRARTPMESFNDSILQEAQHFLKSSKATKETQQEFLLALEEARRWEAKAFLPLRSFEDEVTSSMHKEQISHTDSDLDFSSLESDGSFQLPTLSSSFTDNVLRGKSEHHMQRYWVGLGGATTAQTFLQYATACRKLRFPTTDDNGDENDGKASQQLLEDRKKQQQQLTLSVFERGLAECPTVEALWLAYLKHLTWLWNNDKPNSVSPQAFKTVATRAVRNCPFSLALVKQQLYICLLLANQKQSEHIMDPEELLGIVTKALDSRFLPTPSSALDLFVTAIRVVLQRILSLLATTVLGHDPNKKGKIASILSFDDAELMPSKIPKQKDSNKTDVSADPLDDDAWQEVQDLCEEMRDMFEAAMARLAKDQASWTEGRALLEKEWGCMEQVAITPLLTISSSSTTHTGGKSDDVLSHFEKVIRLHCPPHPDSYRALIQHVLQHGTSIISSSEERSPSDIVSRLRKVRCLYQTAIQSVGKARLKDTAGSLETVPTTTAFRDYETALSCLCHEYQEFERIFGSEQSLANAIRLMQKKLQKTAFQNTSEFASAQERKQGPETATAGLQIEASGSINSKRKAPQVGGSDADARDPPSKKRKTEAHKGDKEERSFVASPQQQSKLNHKVKIGHIFHKGEYPVAAFCALPLLLLYTLFRIKPLIRIIACSSLDLL